MYSQVHAGPRLTAPIALLVLAWTAAALAAGKYFEAAMLAVALATLSGTLPRASPLYLWLALPGALVSAFIVGPERALAAAGRVLVVALAAGSAFSLVSLLDLYLALARLGTPFWAAVMPLLVARQSQLAWYLTLEAKAALSGRGVRGLRLLALLPLPVLLQQVRSSSLLAEALAYRIPRVRPRYAFKPGILDRIVLLYTALASLGCVLG